MIDLPGPLVSSQWLEDHLDEVRVVDVGWSMDQGPHRERFTARHIAGAVFADLDDDLSAPPGRQGRHPLPTPERFAAARSRLGIGTLPVVAYDDRGGATASRLWWMLDAIGHPAAVLDGGLDNWDGPVADGPGAVHNESVDAVAWPADRFINVDDVLEALATGVVLLDARSTERFLGQPNPIDARPGHIPGSVSRPWTDNLDEHGLFLPPDRLRADLAELGLRQEATETDDNRPDHTGEAAAVIASCGSGVTGCHDLLAARLAGMTEGRLYTGSWSDWSLDPDRPIATGDGGPGQSAAGR